MRANITAVIPTLGRPVQLAACLESLASQSIRPGTVSVVHSGDDAETRRVCERGWRSSGLNVQYFHSAHQGAALQRDFAIRRTTTPLILLCEDDVELERDWVASLLTVIEADPRAGAAMGRIVNQPFTSPPGVWRLYRRLVAPRRAHRSGAVVGALVANGFPLDAETPLASEWIGGGITLLRRDAYLEVGGFLPHFRGSSPGEDVDLGYRLSRTWHVYYVPAARCIHHQIPSGREAIGLHQYLSMRSRFAFCRASAGLGVWLAFAHIGLWAAFQTASELGQLRRGKLRPDFLAACAGRLRGAWSCRGWDPSAERFPDRHDTHVNA